MSASAESADDSAASTTGADYTRRLRRLEGARWKKILDVQAPYRWHIRRLSLGRTLDIGCGIGRNLAHLAGAGVGVDHNRSSIEVARTRGFEAYTVEEFDESAAAVPGGFDALLVSHVLEHLPQATGVATVASYLPYLRPNGRVCLITPQEAGYRTDDTHFRFVDFAALDELSRSLGLATRRQYSFPLPRRFGNIFRYNEFVQLSTLDSRPADQRSRASR